MDVLAMVKHESCSRRMSTVLFFFSANIKKKNMPETSHDSAKELAFNFKLEIEYLFWSKFQVTSIRV